MAVEVEEGHLCISCGRMAEPEQDGDVLYFACSCGFESGYRRVAAADPSCQLGVPEDVRRQASVPLPGPVLVTIGRRPE